MTRRSPGGLGRSTPSRPDPADQLDPLAAGFHAQFTPEELADLALVFSQIQSAAAMPGVVIPDVQTFMAADDGPWAVLAASLRAAITAARETAAAAAAPAAHLSAVDHDGADGLSIFLSADDAEPLTVRLVSTGEEVTVVPPGEPFELPLIFANRAVHARPAARPAEG